MQHSTYPAIVCKYYISCIVLCITLCWGIFINESKITRVGRMHRMQTSQKKLLTSPEGTANSIAVMLSMVSFSFRARYPTPPCSTKDISLLSFKVRAVDFDKLYHQHLRLIIKYGYV